MISQKNFFVLMGILAVICFFSLGTGLYKSLKNQNGKTDKDPESVSSEYRWPEFIKNIIAGLCPGIKTTDISYDSFRNNKHYQFSLATARNKPLRILQLKIEGTTDNISDTVFSDFLYISIGSDEEQSGELRHLENSKDKKASASIQVLEKGGTLKVTPHVGARVLMVIDGGEIFLCQKTGKGKYSYNKKL